MIPPLSSKGDVKYNHDRSVDLYFGPERPDEAPASNYIGTNEGEGYFVILRLYSAGKAYFDKTWRPDDVVKVK